MKLSLGVRLLTLSVLTALAGCGGGGALGGLGGGGSSCTPTSYNITYPVIAGISASGSINAASGCFSTATVTSYAALVPTIGSPFVPSGSGTVIAYFGVTFSSTEYASGLPALTVTLPAGTPTTGHSFYLAHNGSGGAALGWSAAVAGPVTATGSSVSFPTSNGNTTFLANQEDELALYEI
jgi:hypothetical protein